MNYFDFVRPPTRALWTLDDDTGEDSGPNGYDLTYGHLDYALGKFGRCGYFDGDNYLTSVSTCPNLALTTMSICFWMKSASTYEQTALGNVDWDYPGRSITYGFKCGISRWQQVSSKVFFDTYNYDASYRITGGSISPNDNKWHWVVITRGAVYTRFYVDGKLDYSESNTSLAYNNRQVTCLGAWWGRYDSSVRDRFYGYIDNMHILGVELNHDTIRHMYAFQMGWI